MCCENTKVYCEKMYRFTFFYLRRASSWWFTSLLSHSFPIEVRLDVVPGCDDFFFSVLPGQLFCELLKKYLASGPVMVIFQMMVPQGRVGVIKIDQQVLFVVAPFWLRSLDWWPQKLHLVKILPLRRCCIFSNSLDLSQHTCPQTFPYSY